MSSNLPIQTSYPLVPAQAFPGMLADSGARDVESALAEVSLDAGLGVIVGTTGFPTPTVKLPGASGDLAKLLGVTVYQAAREPIPSIAPNRFAQGDPVPVLSQGRIWVQIDTTNGAAMVDNGPVYLVFTGADAGRFRGDAGVGPAAVLVPNARCKKGGSAGDVAKIAINLP